MKCMMIMTAVILTFSNVLNAHTQRELSFMDKLNELESNSEEFRNFELVKIYIVSS